MSVRHILDKADAFRPIDAQGRYVARLAALRPLSVAGVYGILDGRSRWPYVGESHAGGKGRLYDTITRHFREWRTSPSRDVYGRRQGGTMYDRARVRVVFRVTEPEAAEDVQFALIQALQPRDNTDDGRSLEPAPF